MLCENTWTRHIRWRRFVGRVAAGLGALNRWRRRVLMRSSISAFRAHLQTCESAVLVVQRLWRGFSTRRRVQKRRAYLERRRSWSAARSLLEAEPVAQDVHGRRRPESAPIAPGPLACSARDGLSRPSTCPQLRGDAPGLESLLAKADISRKSLSRASLQGCGAAVSRAFELKYSKLEMQRLERESQLETSTTGSTPTCEDRFEAAQVSSAATTELGTDFSRFGADDVVRNSPSEHLHAKVTCRRTLESSGDSRPVRQRPQSAKAMRPAPVRVRPRSAQVRPALETDLQRRLDLLHAEAAQLLVPDSRRDACETGWRGGPEPGDGLCAAHLQAFFAQRREERDAARAKRLVGVRGLQSMKRSHSAASIATCLPWGPQPLALGAAKR